MNFPRPIIPAAFFAVIFSAGAAHAQGAESVDLSPIVDIGVQILVGVLVLVATWAGNEARKWLRENVDFYTAQMDERLEGVIDRAVQRGANRGANYIRNRAESAGWTRVEIENQLVRSGMGYVINNAPEALKRFGIMDEKGRVDAAKLREIVEARIWPFDVDDTEKAVNGSKETATEASEPPAQ